MSFPRIIIGSDHGGYKLKEHLRDYLKRRGFQVQDFGCYSTDSVDYPDIAFLVANTVANSDNSFGIMIDTFGVASAMVCNKVPGIRAAVVWNETVAQSSREHNNANIITLGEQSFRNMYEVESVVKKWLDTRYSGGRHERRVQKISDVENHFIKN